MKSFICLLILCLPIFAQGDSFDLSAPNYNMGAWDPQHLTYTDGLTKLQRIDDWYFKLSDADKKTYAQEFVLNRNRLFLVTEEKRLATAVRDLEVPDLAKTTKTPWLKDSAASLRNEDRERLKVLQAYNATHLGDPKKLSTKLITNLEEANDVSASNTLFGGSSSNSVLSGRSYSKSMAVGRSDFGLMSVRPSSSFQVQFDSPAMKRLMRQRDRELAKAKTEAEKDAIRRKFTQQVLSTIDSTGGDALKKTDPADEERKDQEYLLSTLQKRRKPFCEGDGAKVDNNFDSKDSPAEAAFLKELGIKSWKPTTNEKDLSSWFGPPQNQFSADGSPQATCVGFAIANDAKATLMKSNFFRRPPDMSPLQIYDVVKIKDEGQRRLNPTDRDYCDTKSYSTVSLHAGVNSVRGAYEDLKQVPLCSKDGNSQFQIQNFATLEIKHEDDARPDYDFFRILIDHGYPPVVSIAGDDRSENENWLTLPGSGSMQHVFNIVGYGEDVDPQTLCKKKYFLVRDSFTKKPMHYKVDAATLIAQLTGVYKATQVKDVTPSFLGHLFQSGSTGH